MYAKPSQIFWNYSLLIATLVVWMIVSILIGIDVIPLVIGTIVSEIRKEVIIVDAHRQAYNIITCTADNLIAYWIVIGLLVALKVFLTSTSSSHFIQVALSAYGVYLSIRLRRVKLKIYNESVIMAFGFVETT